MRYTDGDRVLVADDYAKNGFAVTLVFGRAHEVTHLHNVLAGDAVEAWIRWQIEAVVAAQRLRGSHIKQFSLSPCFGKVDGFGACVEGSLPFCGIVCVADELLSLAWNAEFIVFPVGIRERTVPQRRCSVEQKTGF